MSLKQVRRRHVDPRSGLTRSELAQLMYMQERDRMNGETEPERINPDNMTYEQLLELEDKMGKVSKGLDARQIHV